MSPTLDALITAREALDRYLLHPPRRPSLRKLIRLALDEAGAATRYARELMR